MSDRKPVFIVLAIGAAITLAIVFALDRSSAPREPAPVATTSASAAPSDDPPILHGPAPFKRPAMAVAELAVITDRPKAELDAAVDPKAAVALLKSQHCGDATTCEKVKAFLLEAGHLRLDVLPAKAWNVPPETHMPRVGPTLSEAERAKVLKAQWVVRVLVSGPPLPGQMPIRGGFGLAVALAEKTQGTVHDQVTDRLEKPADFAKRAVTSPLDQPAFRKDRIDYQYTTRQTGSMRLITAGMIRYGAPDLEVFGATREVAQRLTDVLGALGAAMAAGAKTSPIKITLGDIESARGAKFEDSAAMPPPIPIDIDLEDIPPETGDPNDVMVRVIPPDGPSPEGYEDLSASFFGAAGDAPSPEEELRATRTKAQMRLADALARWRKMKPGASLFVEIPFPTDASGATDPMSNPDAFDFLSIEVTAFDATTVTGTVYEDPGGALGVKKGDSVTRKQTEVTDYVMRLPDGGIEGASIPE